MNNTPLSDNSESTNNNELSDSTPLSEEQINAAVCDALKQRKKELLKKMRAPLVLRILAWFFAAVSVLGIILRAVLSFCPWTAEAFYRTVIQHLQAGLAYLTSPLPFSLAETVIVLLPVAVIMLAASLFLSYRRFEIRKFRTILTTLIILVGYTSSSYMFCISMLYCRPSLSELSGIPDTPVSAEELRSALDVMAQKINARVQEKSILFDSDGASVCPYGFDELSDRIDSAYEKYSRENRWISPHSAKAKQIALSNYMTYTHISGIYTPYTGEANINVNYPDYITVSTMAHEKAHQRGIAPENEANLTAMFVLCESADPYLEYCGYMSVFFDVLSAYLQADVEGYIDYYISTAPQAAYSESEAYSEFFDEYRDSNASEVSNAVNDTFLKANGETAGILSYGMVVDMAVNYINGKQS